MLAVLVAVAVLAAGVAGVARYLEARATPPPALANARGAHLIEGVVRADPTTHGRFGRLDLDVDHLDARPTSGGVRISFVLDSAPPHEDDRLAIRCEIEAPPEVEACDYPAYLAGRDIYGVVGFPEDLRILNRNEGSSITRALRALRRGAINHIERSLPEPESSLAVGMLIGRQGNLAPDLEADFRSTGTSHLVVVSGQNVALVLSVLTAGLATVVSRRRAALLALAALPGYVVLVSAEPPIVRAVVMAVGSPSAAQPGGGRQDWPTSSTPSPPCCLSDRRSSTASRFSSRLRRPLASSSSRHRFATPRAASSASAIGGWPSPSSRYGRPRWLH
ncbi:MAG: DUF4131 domain-containing protein [Dehalococcoidia bacterium]|nr:DUF4131 domain-containing protein [Dehalococcoidia bacterium]